MAITVLYLDHTAKWSGGEIALLRMLNALDRSHVTPVVVLAEDGPLVASLSSAGIETHVLPLSSRVRNVRKDTLGVAALGHVAALRDLFLYAGVIARFARRRGADLLHTNSLKSDIYGAVAGRLARLPVVWHIRDHIHPSYLPRAAVRAFRLLARKLPACVVTNSQSTLDTLTGSRPVPHSAVIHDGLGDEELAAGHRAAAAGPWRPPVRIGLVGRITPWKGQHIFLEAAAKVAAAGFDARFILIGAPMFGEEAYEQELRRQVQALGIESRVEFMGFRNDVPDLLRGLDILVHASTIPEPFGQVVIEAMAEGLPVVATAGGGIKEIVDHGENGLLVPMGDAGALARELTGLLSDPERAHRLGAAGYAHVRRCFTAAQTARKIEAVYNEMLTSGPRRLSSPPLPAATEHRIGKRGESSCE